MTTKNKPKFKVGDAVVIWNRNGAGIYEGNINYVRSVDNGLRGIRYGLSDVNEGGARGNMPQDALLSLDEFQAKVDSGEVARVWQGSAEKLERILSRKPAKQRGRPRLNLNNKPRQFHQIERNSQFDAAILIVRKHLASVRSVDLNKVSVSAAIRFATVIYSKDLEDEMS